MNHEALFNQSSAAEIKVPDRPPTTYCGKDRMTAAAPMQGTHHKPRE